ncbi:MAG: Xaa-Pro peptidase family protein [Candidatus Aminicenantes bacterium]|nr:Xaa-Pro peptidase family protein [Candidatus Aminicenantes bacterium]
MISRRRFLKQAGLTAVSLGALTSVASSEGAPQSLAQPQSTTKNMLAGVVPLTAADYEARLEKARRLMADHNLDGLFLGGGTNLLYFTAVSWWLSERTFGAVLNRKGAPVWVCPAFEKERARELVPAGQEVRTWEENESPFRLIGGILKDLGAGTGRLGLAPDLRSFEVFGLRRDAPSWELVNGAIVTERCRGAKTAKELGFLDLANTITKMAYQEAFKKIQVGMTQQDLSAAISAAHQKLGVGGGGGPQFGANTAFPHGSRNPRITGQNDVVMVDGGCSVEGYRSDVTRTVVFGTPTDKQKKVWDIVKRAQLAALKAVRPGAECQDVDRAARRVIEEAGFGPGYAYFAHRVGHGIGLEGHEYPFLVQGNTLKLEPGMTFSNEPGIYIYGEFGVRIEDCMAVTEDGGRFLGGMESTAIDKPFGE